jgi:hypothetical protein
MKVANVVVAICMLGMVKECAYWANFCRASGAEFGSRVHRQADGREARGPISRATPRSQLVSIEYVSIAAEV